MHYLKGMFSLLVRLSVVTMCWYLGLVIVFSFPAGLLDRTICATFLGHNGAGADICV